MASHDDEALPRREHTGNRLDKAYHFGLRFSRSALKHSKRLFVGEADQGSFVCLLDVDGRLQVIQSSAKLGGEFGGNGHGFRLPDGLPRRA